MKAAGYDKLLTSRLEGHASSRRVEGVMNCLQVWATNYREQYNMRYAEWRFYAVPHIMEVINVSDYIDSDIELKLIKLEEEEAQQLAEMEAANMGGDNSNLYEEEEAFVLEIRDTNRTMINVWSNKYQ